MERIREKVISEQGERGGENGKKKEKGDGEQGENLEKKKMMVSMLF